MKLINGKEIAESILKSVAMQVAKLPFKPLFCDILVGDNPVSAQYVRMKGQKAESIGIKFQEAKFPENISTQKLIEEIQKLNQEKNLCGLIVQLPLPKSLVCDKIINSISPGIDADCMGKANSEKFYSGQIDMPPPTAAAIMAILDTLNIDLTAKNILVVGQGNLVGKPVSYLLKRRNLKVSTADKFTVNINSMIRQADIVISATGKAGLITGEKIKPGSIIIDAGTSESNGSIVGDVDIESVKDIADMVSPVPGGVGPVTVAMLLKNILHISKKKGKSIL